MLDKNKSIVLFSGGQDSSACLLWALSKFEEVQTIGFDYGQRHNIEMECRINLLKRIQLHSSNFLGKLSNDIVINLEEIKNISESSLLNSENIGMLENGLPNTFVPGRNLIFLNYASIIAYKNKMIGRSKNNGKWSIKPSSCILVAFVSSQNVRNNTVI